MRKKDEEKLAGKWKKIRKNKYIVLFRRNIMIMFQENYTKEKTNKWSVAGIHTNQNIE